MANTVIVKVKVQELTKYGFKANDRYVGLSKNLSESDKTKLVPGAFFEAEFYIADSGKEYLNKVLRPIAEDVMGAFVSTPETRKEDKTQPGVDTSRAKHFVPKFIKKETVSDSEKMTKADWNQKDRNMMIGGRSHDAAVLVAAALTVGVSVADALKQYREALEGLLKIAEEVK